MPLVALIRRVGIALILGGTLTAICYLIATKRGHVGPSLSLPVVRDETLRLVPGEYKELRFLIANKGGDMLSIRDIKVSCGCTSASMNNPFVPSGTAGILTVKFHAPPEGGQFAHQVDFSTNDPKKPLAAVGFSGTAMWPVNASPSSLSWADPPGVVCPPKEFEVFSTTGSALALGRTSTDAPWIKVVPSDRSSEPHRSRFRVTVHANPGKGRRSGNIRIETNEPARPVLIVSILQDVTPKIKVIPAKFILTPTEVDSIVRTTFIISDEHATPKIEELKIIEGTWKIERWSAKPESGTNLSCEVELRSPQTPGYHRSTLSIRTDSTEPPKRIEFGGLIKANSDRG